MKIVICVKQVLDPSAVDNYVLVGKLEIGADGKTLTDNGVPANAKTEFVKYLDTHAHDLRAKVVAVETVDHPSDGRTSLQRVSHIVTGLKVGKDGVITVDEGKGTGPDIESIEVVVAWVAGVQADEDGVGKKMADILDLGGESPRPGASCR